MYTDDDNDDDDDGNNDGRDYNNDYDYDHHNDFKENERKKTQQALKYTRTIEHRYNDGKKRQQPIGLAPAHYYKFYLYTNIKKISKMLLLLVFCQSVFYGSYRRMVEMMLSHSVSIACLMYANVLVSVYYGLLFYFYVNKG